MTRVLLCSTYELGTQPLGCAVPAAQLSRAGHEVRMTDLSIDTLSDDDVVWADAVAISVPMHTAVRLGFDVLARIREIRPTIPVAFHGLYAPIAEKSGLFHANDLIAAGDVEQALVTWANTATAAKKDSEGPTVSIDIGSPSAAAHVVGSAIPLRVGLPPLSSYAQLVQYGPNRLVGAVETTTGCNHRCRHCPVPVVYNGRSRLVDESVVLSDIDQLVQAGATHIHFGDPDFLNRPAHARRIVDGLHEAHDHVTFDVTVKVSHIIRDHDIWEHFAACGLIFVISAFESTSDEVLAQLDKGHVRDDLAKAVTILRGANIEPRPSLLPFTPWTTVDDLVDLFDFVAQHDLIYNVDPVQFAIRLLLPPGSLLLQNSDPVLANALGEVDPDGVAITWRSPIPVLDELASAMTARAELAASKDEPTMTTYLALRELLYQSTGRVDKGVPEIIGIGGPVQAMRPRLSESWFCCAEPTAIQRAAIA